MNVGFYRADLAGRGFLTQGKHVFVFPVHLLVPLELVCRKYTDNINRRLVLRCREGVCVSSYTCNRRSHLWDNNVEPREAFCCFLRIVSPNGCLVLPLLGTPIFSFLFSPPVFSFLLLSSFLEGGNKYVLSCVIQHEAGGLSKNGHTYYVCMVITHSNSIMDQPGKVANPARGQLNRENGYSPVRVRA